LKADLASTIYADRACCCAAYFTARRGGLFKETIVLTDDFILRFEVPLRVGDCYEESRISINPGIDDLADLGDSLDRDSFAKIAALERYRARIEAFRSGLQHREYWRGHVQAGDLFAADASLCAEVVAVDLCLIGLAEVRVADSATDVLVLIPKQRLAAVNSHALLRQLQSIPAHAKHNIREQVLQRQARHGDASLVLRLMVPGIDRNCVAVRALRNTVAIAMHYWLIERDAAGISGVRRKRSVLQPAE
jgi:hypothetical protein